MEGRLGLETDKCRLKIRVFPIACVHVYHPSGGTALPFIYIISAAKVLVFIKDYLALGLRRIVHRSVACWIRSLFSRLRSSCCWEDSLPQVLAVKDRASTKEDPLGSSLIMWYQISGLLTARFC